MHFKKQERSFEKKCVYNCQRSPADDRNNPVILQSKRRQTWSTNTLIRPMKANNKEESTSNPIQQMYTKD